MCSVVLIYFQSLGFRATKSFTNSGLISADLFSHTTYIFLSSMFLSITAHSLFQNGPQSLAPEIVSVHQVATYHVVSAAGTPSQASVQCREEAKPWTDKSEALEKGQLWLIPHPQSSFFRFRGMRTVMVEKGELS